jgi:hypothetical protein
MKKILFILLAGFSITVFKANAQVLKTTSTMGEQHTSPESLLLKSKKQKTTAWILLALGAGTVITAYAIESAKVNNDPLGYILPYNTEKFGIAIIAGGALMIASVPFFISSGKNKRKANVIIRNESATFLHPSSPKINFYVVGIQIKL